MEKFRVFLRVWVVVPLALALSGCATTQNIRIAIDDLRAKAEQGDPAAQFQLGMAYDSGVRVAKNQGEAALWYRKAAEQNYAPAQSSLGSLYQFGVGVQQSDTEAIRWYQKAVDQGFPTAFSNLGYMYDMGLGVPQDKARAATLYRSAAEKGCLEGMLNLGMSYWRGEGVQKDLIQAHMWLDLARSYGKSSGDTRVHLRARTAWFNIEREMTTNEISASEKMAKEWDASHRPK